MKIKVISLRRSEGRRNSFSEANQRLEYEFFDAVDGAALSDDEKEDGRYFARDLGYSKGAYGCALSHIKLWKRCSASQEALTIAEDDAVFRADFESEAKRFIASLPPDWDMVLWGWNFDTILGLEFMRNVSPAFMKFDQDQMRKGLDFFVSSVEKANAFRLSMALGIPAYTLSPKGAKTLLDRCLPLKRHLIDVPLMGRSFTNTGIDNQMNLVYPEINAFVALPPLVVTLNENSKSTVQKRKGVASRWFKKVKTSIRKSLGKRNF